jgi:hypothetical protein
MKNNRWTGFGAVAALVLWALPGAAVAQSDGLPPVGRLVRVELHDGRRAVGTRVAAPRDTVRLQARDGSEEAFALKDINTIAVRGGTDWGRGAKRGALVGGSIGLALMAGAVYYDKHSTEESFIPATVVAAPVAAGITLIGTGIGLLASPEGWARPIGVSTRTSSFRVGLQLRF